MRAVPILASSDFDANQTCAKALRKLADALDSNEASPHRAVLSTRMQGDEFHVVTLVFSY